jgi:6-phosphogluconolactonase
MLLPRWKKNVEKSALTRRNFAIASAVLSLGFLGACTTPVPQSARAGLIYVGTDGNQIRALRFDASTGKLTMIGPVADVSKPRWAVAHPQLPVLYVTSDNGAQDGSVIAFAMNGDTGGLTKINEISAGGSGTTHLWLDAPSMTLLASNFGGGSASSFAVNSDGSLRVRVSTLKAAGSGPHRRQASPHAHSAAVDPSGRYALVSDLGADRVFVYGFDRATHALLPDDATHPRSFVAPPGSGPRQSVFDLKGRFVYVLNELTAEVMTLRWDAQQGRLTRVHSVPVSSPEFQGAKSGSALAVSRDGRFVYVGNRGEHALVVYRVNPDSGELSLVQRVSSGGELPWSFAIHPSGKWMLITHQRSNRVNVFGIDPASGRLSDTGQSVDSPAPVSVTFMESA